MPQPKPRKTVTVTAWAVVDANGSTFYEASRSRTAAERCIIDPNKLRIIKLTRKVEVVK